MRRTTKEPRLGTFYRMSGRYFSRPSRSYRQDQEAVTDKRIPGRHNSHRQCGALHGVSEQKEGIHGKTGERQTKESSSLLLTYVFQEHLLWKVFKLIFTELDPGIHLFYSVSNKSKSIKDIRINSHGCILHHQLLSSFLPVFSFNIFKKSAQKEKVMEMKTAINDLEIRKKK